MEQELVQANANLPSGNAPTKRVINWGGVLKGVAIVGAIVVVAAVAMPAFSAIGAYISSAITGSTAASGAAVGITEGIAWIGDSLVYGANFIGGALGELGTMAVEGLGLEGVKWGGAAATTNAIGVAGATAATALAAKAAMPTLQHLQLGMDVPVDNVPTGNGVDNSLLAQQGVHGSNAAMHHSSLHEAAHAAHHAAEHHNKHAEAVESDAPEEQKNWREKFAQKATLQNHTVAVGANRSSRAIPRPAASFGEQIATDRANLDAALAK